MQQIRSLLKDICSASSCISILNLFYFTIHVANTTYNSVQGKTLDDLICLGCKGLLLQSALAAQFPFLKVISNNYNKKKLSSYDLVNMYKSVDKQATTIVATGICLLQVAYDSRDNLEPVNPKPLFFMSFILFDRQHSNPDRGSDRASPSTHTMALYS